MKNGLDVMLNKLQNSEKEVVALKAEKQNLGHELKNTKNTSLASVRDKKNENKTKLTFNHLFPPSVQRAPRQVQNSHHAKSHQKVPPSSHGKPPHMKRRFQQIHTCQGKNQVRNALICFNCNKPGHLAKHCWNRNQNFNKHAKSVQCFHCHKIGHISRDCRYRNDFVVHAQKFQSNAHAHTHRNKHHVHIENVQKFHVYRHRNVAQ
ncbi:hypothetical protein Taro_002042, partial [Colocasia esculenta]|nr:hypothetical protein [Colocasia esculenta]